MPTLAAALGVAPARVSEWENGKRNPSGQTAVRLAALLGGRTEDYLNAERNAK